jgi:hypothetical protein
MLRPQKLQITLIKGAKQQFALESLIGFIA